jgi:hypothetical protein
VDKDVPLSLGKSQDGGSLVLTKFTTTCRRALCAQVAELVDAQDLGSCAFGREGSIPSLGINERLLPRR